MFLMVYVCVNIYFFFYPEVTTLYCLANYGAAFMEIFLLYLQILLQNTQVRGDRTNMKMNNKRNNVKSGNKVTHF
jgi:hypothetical protein